MGPGGAFAGQGRRAAEEGVLSEWAQLRRGYTVHPSPRWVVLLESLSGLGECTHRPSLAPTGMGCGFPYTGALTGFPCSPAARPTSTWASSWRENSHTRTQPPTMSWPGSTAIMPTLPAVRQPGRRAWVLGRRTNKLTPQHKAYVLAVVGTRGVLRSSDCHPLSAFSLLLDRLQTRFQLLEGQEIRGGHRSLPRCKPPTVVGGLLQWRGALSGASHPFSLGPRSSRSTPTTPESEKKFWKRPKGL